MNQFAIQCFVILLLMFSPSFFSAQVFPVTTIENNGASEKRINLVFMGDGYTLGEIPDYINDVTGISNDLFSQTPFVEYAAFFNVYAIEVPSNESGTDHAGTATDVTEPVFPVSFADTYFNTKFDAFNIHRLLTANNTGVQYSVLADNVPDYDQPFILVNSPEYGGAGGFFATSSTHPSASEIAIHEIGHSFGGLADEYWAGDIYASEKPNMTEETNPALVKWNEWYGEQGVGINQHCCGGISADWYRPHQSCKMRYLGSPFCAVCRQRIIDVIYSMVTPIDDYAPSNLNPIFDGTPLIFSLDLVLPNPNTLEVEWFVNGVSINTGSASITLDGVDLMEGFNDLSVIITDQTDLSRSYLPANGYTFNVDWTIDNQVDLCPTTYEVLEDPITSGTYQAGIELSSASTVTSGVSVIFKGGQIVTLENGFEVELQGVFTAENEGCGDDN